MFLPFTGPKKVLGIIPGYKNIFGCSMMNVICEENTYVWKDLVKL